MKFTLLVVIILLFSTCKKSAPKDQLPPATQIGANSFGCLINGKLYTPRGFEQNRPSFQMIVDPTNDGNLDIRTFRKENGIMESFAFSCFGIIKSGIYQSRIYPTYAKDINSSICYYVNSDSSYRMVNLNITRYDLHNRIISGTFEMKLYDPSISCDTIRITQGRFDKKFN